MRAMEESKSESQCLRKMGVKNKVSGVVFVSANQMSSLCVPLI
jgi:hypothetical protein